MEEMKGIFMQFAYEELALLNQVIGIALTSGQIEFNEVAQSIHKKVTNEIVKQNNCEENGSDIGG